MIEVSHLSKSYGSRPAVQDLSFTVPDGQIYGLLGPNGAGKSTIMNILTGYLAPTEGEVKVAGFRLPEQAQQAKACVGYLPEQPPLYPEMTVQEYLDFVAELKGVKHAQRKQQVLAAARRTGLEEVLPRVIRSLSKGYRQRVGIAQALVGNPKVIIFDEPTALLENEKVDMLFRFIGELKSQGVSIIYISHRLEEIMQICDSVTILKDGSYVDTMPIENVTKDSLIQMMVGRPATDIYNIRHFDTDEELLRVENFSDSKHFKNINFTLHKGEILGFAGLVGAGRSEVMRALTAVEKRLSGDVYLKGKKVHLSNPTDALKHGIGFLTYQSILKGEANLVVSIVTLLMLIFVVCNLVVDMLYAALDPRIRYA